MENNERTSGNSDHSSTPKATRNIRLEDAEKEDIGKAIVSIAVATEHSDGTESEDSDYIGSNEEVYGSCDEEDSETESEDDGNDGEGSSHPDPEATVEFFNDDAFPELSTVSTPIGAPHLLACSNKWKWAKLSLFDFEMLSVPDAIVTVLYNVDKAALRVFLDHEHYEAFEFRRVELSQDCASMSMVIKRVRKRVLCGYYQDGDNSTRPGMIEWQPLIVCTLPDTPGHPWFLDGVSMSCFTKTMNIPPEFYMGTKPLIMPPLKTFLRHVASEWLTKMVWEEMGDADITVAYE